MTASLPASSAATPRRKLLIVYHTMTGGTLQMAHAAAGGASREPSVDVQLLQAARAGPDEVLAADGLIFATPENLAAMSGMMKDFFDRSYYAALDRINGRPYACMVCAGSGGSNAVRQIDRIAAGWRLRQVAPRADRLHARANAGRDPAPEAHCTGRAGAVRQHGSCPGNGAGPGHLLTFPCGRTRERPTIRWSEPAFSIVHAHHRRSNDA